MVASLVFIFSCGGRGGGGIQEEEWVNLSKGYINGVVKEYSRYHLPKGDIGSGVKDADQAIFLIKKDGTFKICDVDIIDYSGEGPSKYLDLTFGKYRMVGDTLVFTADPGDPSSTHFKILSKTFIEIKEILDPPLEDGTSAEVLVYEKLESPSSMSLDDFFKKSCEDFSAPLKEGYSF
jgi:hypothetical protein